MFRKAMFTIMVYIVMIPSLLMGSISCAADDADLADVPLSNLMEGWPQMSQISEASGIVMDADNGAVLYSLNRDTIRYPASITKILTALLVIENCPLDGIVTMTDAGIQMVIGGSANAKTVLGEEFTVEQCLYMMLLKSANDIANQLAEYCGGSLSHFAEMMNEKAASLGCENTHFTNPSGMPDSDHYTTAEDMARIMRACLENETFLRISRAEGVTIPPTNKTAESREYTNHNQLIIKGGEYYYEPCISGKTGYTDSAWRTYIGAAEKDGRKLIVCLMRGPDKSDFVDAANLFEYGFNEFDKLEVPGGSVTLPKGFTLDDTTMETQTLSDGSVLISYYYDKLPVGSAVMTAAEYDEQYRTSTLSAAPQESVQEGTVTDAAKVETEKPKTQKNSGGIFILIAVLFAIAALLTGLLLIERIRSMRKK